MLYVELESLLVRTPPNPRGPCGFHALLAIAERGTPFTAVGGRAFISVPAQSGGHLTFSIRSRAFRQFFFDQCFSLYDTIPTTHAFSAILHHLEAQAASDPHRCHIGVPYRVDCRGLSSTPEKILLDLANPEGQFVEITPEGWTVASQEGVFFETSPSTRSLPPPPTAPPPPPNSPTPRHPIHPSRPSAPPSTSAPQVPPVGSAASPGSSPPSAHTAPIPSSSSAVLPAAANPSPPASSRSASTLTRRTSLPPPRDLLPPARLNWVLAFDHVSPLTPQIADPLCRLTSGVGVAYREPGQAR